MQPFLSHEKALNIWHGLVGMDILHHMMNHVEILQHIHVATEMKYIPEIHEDHLLCIAVAWLKTGGTTCIE